MTSQIDIHVNGVFNQGAWTLHGAGSVQAALSDFNDSSYVTGAYNSGRLALSLAAPALPAFAKILYVQVVVRTDDSGPSSYEGVLTMRASASGNYIAPPFYLPTHGPADPQTYVAGNWSADPDGNTWTAASLSDVQLIIDPSTTVNVYEIYMSVFYNQAPTATVALPSGNQATSQPTVQWNYADADGDPMERYDLKIFDSATYNATGFNPDTSTAAWTDSQTVATSSSVVGVPLSNGVTYKAYVRVGDAGTGGNKGPWGASPAFTIVLNAPGTPTISASNDDVGNRVALTVSGSTNVTGSVSQFYVVERNSDLDGGWVTARTFPDLSNVVDFTKALLVYDYEAPRGTLAQYRVRAFATVSGNLVASAYSNIASTTVAILPNVWIKDPLNPSANTIITLDQHDFVLTRQESMGIHFALNRRAPLVIHGTVQAPTFPLVLFFSDDDSYYAWKELLQDSQHSLLLQTYWGDGGRPPDNVYFIVTEQVDDTYLTTDGMKTSQLRSVAFTAQQVDAP